MSLISRFVGMRIHRSLLIWGLFCSLSGILFLAYVFASLAGGRGEIVLPLDDVYIHFQYAKQIANGQPYVYNPGQPATSGATSFLYPYLLASGYLIGFQGLNLGLWALILGAAAMLGALCLVYRLARAFDAPHWLAVLSALIFGLSGAVNWHFFSGMETGLMMLLTLATLDSFAERRFWPFILSASLLALTRPEGSFLAVIAVVLWFVTARQSSASHPGPRFTLVIPILAGFVQPAINLAFTGSIVATGNSAKSVFGLIPFHWDLVLGRIAGNFGRMWAEFTTSVSPREGLYFPYLIGPLAFMALFWSLLKRDRWQTSLLVILWLLAGTAAIATLDTAFWHFKRYQMPLIALFFPLAAWTLTQFIQTGKQKPAARKYAAYILGAGGILIALSTSAAFLHHFALNVDYVYLQPLQMARWLQANTPADAVIAVHDVGMMRYLGDRTTLDIVGLTTPDAAAYWRNGPGSVAEFLMQENPDYIASYGEGHGLGLGMIAQTSIYGKPLAEFPVTLDPNYNVALAADYQGIYGRWNPKNNADRAQIIPQHNTHDMVVVNSINVANLASEQAHRYQFHSSERLAGFPTEVHELNTTGCPSSACIVVDGGRHIDLEESFVAQTLSGKDALLVTRLLPQDQPGTFDVYLDDRLVAKRWIPAVPGKWLEVATLLAGDQVTDKTQIRIVPDNTQGQYTAYYHWIYQGSYPSPAKPDHMAASFQNGSFSLLQFSQSFALQRI